MIAEFRVDLLDDTFNHALDIVEELFSRNYDRAKIIFTEMSPAVFTRLDFELFVELLDEAVYGY